MGELAVPAGPVVGHVVAPDVELAAQALGPEQAREPAAALQRAGGVLPLPLADDEQQVDLRAQPVQVAALQAPDVVERVVEVRRVAALAPAVPGARVVVA